MTKEQKIKEAWGEYYDEIEFYLTESGFMPYVYDVRMIRNENKIEFEHLPNCANLFRPKSLQGIENNNGWIKIESESDLPNDNGLTDYHVFNFTNQYKHIRTTYKKREVKELWEQEEITHYKPIKKPKPPIY